MLAGCAGVKNVQTVKSTEFSGTPRNIVAVQQNGDPFSAQVKEAFRAKLASCGVALQFVPPPPPGQSINAPGADGLLAFKELGKETTTVSNKYAVIDKYPDMYRYEFSLTDLKSRKDVWKGRGDFTTREQSKDSIFRGSPGDAWSQTLLDLMKKDGLITDCDPAKLPAAAAVTMMPVAAAAPGAAPAAGGAGTISFNVGGVVYKQVDDALAASRTEADKKVAAASRPGSQAYDSLLVAIPTPTEIENASVKITGLAHEADFKKYIVGSRQIQIESYVQAFRKTGMFKSVTTVASDQITANELRGSQYTLSFAKTEAKTPGAWTLASAKGQQSFQIAAKEDKGDVQAMLDKAQAAIDSLPR